MSNWNVAPMKGTIQHTDVNLNNVPSVLEPVKKAIISKPLSVVIAIIVIVLCISAVMIPVALVLTHTGPFSTTTSSSSNVVTATTSGSTATSSASTTTTTTVSSTTTVTTISTTISTTTIPTTTGVPSQCSSYTTINDATRLQTAAAGTVCDSSVFNSNIIWVRFNGAGGTQLATSAPGVSKCGTQATGWYSGSLPTSGVTTNGTVCYQWGSNTCNWSNTILVTNCGAFYVFGLIMPPVCNLRYCTA